MYYTRRPDVRIQCVDGETLVLDDQHGYIHQFNSTASFIWQQCDGRSTKSDIVRRFAREFDVEEVAAKRDVTAVIGQLLELQLLRENLGEQKT
jgi:hypothetical protein